MVLKQTVSLQCGSSCDRLLYRLSPTLKLSLLLGMTRVRGNTESSDIWASVLVNSLRTRGGQKKPGLTPQFDAKILAVGANALATQTRRFSHLGKVSFSPSHGLSLFGEPV